LEEVADIERWFEQRRKLRVLEIAYRQMTLALDTVNALETSVKAATVGDKETAKTTIDRLFIVEEEIDNLRRTVFEELTRGKLPTQDREDIMNLVKNLDTMADHVKNSARNVLVLLDAKVPAELWKGFLDMSHGVVRCAAVLKESLGYLGEKPSEARAASVRVEDEEKKVDTQFLVIKSLLLKYGEEVNPAILLILKDLLDAMEEAADACADTGDYIRVLTVS
jgi:predicted phosphate transport protein (TIGR00153 family)